MEKHADVHVEAPSFWPIVLAAGLALMAIGVVSSFVVSILGVIILLGSIAGWAMENRSEQEKHDE